MKNLYWGNTLNIPILVKENGVAKNCTGLSANFIVKAKDLHTDPIVLNKVITWTSITTGEGYFSITEAESSALTVKKYFYEIILQDDPGTTYRKTINKGELIVLQSLGLT